MFGVMIYNAVNAPPGVQYVAIVSENVAMFRNHVIVWGHFSSDLICGPFAYVNYFSA